jgi:hypothetical protein
LAGRCPLFLANGALCLSTPKHNGKSGTVVISRVKIIGYQFGTKLKLVFCAKYERGLDLGFWEILKPLKWTNITSFFLIWLKRSTKFFISL